MKKLVKRVGSSSHAQFVIFGITLLLAVVGVVAVSATPKAFASRASEQNAGSPGDNPVVQQEKSKLYAQPVRMVGERILGPVGLGGIDRPARIPKSLNPTANALINNNNGSTGTAYFTQSETTLVAFGSTIVVGFNDSGSFNGGDHFTGWSRSTDGGATWTDGGTLPFSQIGDAGDPVMARDNTTGRIYFATLGLNGIATIQVFLSDDGGATFQAPINGTPGGSAEDKDWITVDNFGGAGNGNVYLVSRRFGSPQRGINFYRSTDGGATFGPSGGTNITIDSLSQGAFVTVTPDHSVHAYWYDGPTIQVRKSTDQGLTFDAPVTVAFGLIGGANGDLGLTGMRQGTGTFDYFRSNEFPHAAVNPVSGSIYVTYDNQGAGSDKADVFLTQSTDGGATWTAPVKVNDDSTTTDQWMPTVAVSTAGDRLGIFYYSRQEDPASNNLFKRYGRIATISGGTVTFTPSVAVSDTASLPEFGRDSVISGVYMGDYDQVYATPGAFNIVWSDNRSDLPGGAPRKDPNVYYDKISLAPVPQSAFSRKVQGGAGTFDVALPLTGNVGIECRSGGATNDYQMIVNFASAVTVESVAVTSGTGSVSSFSVSGSQVTVNLTGVTNVQRITVTLFNVNDGTHMGDVPVSMGVLVGDVNGNGLVNASDVSLTKSQVGQPVSGSNFREDVNANGLINSVDVAQVKANVGTALPP